MGGYTAGPATIQHIVQPGDRLTRLAARYYNAAHLWRVIAVANGIDDPSNLEVGRTLLIPPQEEIPAGGIVVPGR